MEGPSPLEILSPLPANQEPEPWAQAKEHMQEARADLGTVFHFLGAEARGAPGLVQEAVFWVGDVRGAGRDRRVGGPLLGPPNLPAEGGVHRAEGW